MLQRRICRIGGRTGGEKNRRPAVAWLWRGRRGRRRLRGRERRGRRSGGRIGVWIFGSFCSLKAALLWRTAFRSVSEIKTQTHSGEDGFTHIHFNLPATERMIIIAQVLVLCSDN